MELEQAAAARGLLISVVPLPIVDANGAELGRDSLLQTAQRYGGDEVLVGRADTAAPGQWQWTLNTAYASQSWSGALAAGVDGTVDTLAPPQGGSLAQAEAETLIQIEGVTGLTDYAAMQRMFEAVPGVRKANVAEANGSSVTFDVVIRGGADALDRALTGSARLVRAGSSNGRLVYQYHST
jgi:hypothetical protein